MSSDALVHFRPLEELEASALTFRLYMLRKQERELLVEFLLYLGELERRKVHLEIGYSSVFVFLTDHLGYPRASAYRRYTACRLLAKFPAIGPHLADGRLNLTTLVELREVLAEETLAQTLDRAAGRTEEQVRELVAAMKPRPEPDDLLRRLPRARIEPPAPPAPPILPGLSLVPPPPPATPVPPLPPPAPTPTAPRMTITPISDERRVLRVTVGRQVVEDLEAVRSALSHVLPGADLETVLGECVRRTREALERRRRGAGKQKSHGTPRGRHLPAAIRWEVWKRDEGRCTFTGPDGHRCGSTHQLQLHHILAFALGGPTTVENLTLHCRVHNVYVAEKEGLAGWSTHRAAP